MDIARVEARGGNDALRNAGAGPRKLAGGAAAIFVKLQPDVVLVVGLQADWCMVRSPGWSFQSSMISSPSIHRRTPSSALTKKLNMGRCRVPASQPRPAGREMLGRNAGSGLPLPQLKLTVASVRLSISSRKPLPR
jgi:hypothetical protein